MDYVKNNMKGRAYRRYMEEIKVIGRLRRKQGRWSRIKDANDAWMVDFLWIDMIGTPLAWDSKSFTTDVVDSRYKAKWGLKGKKRKYRDSSDPWTRAKDRKRYKKELENDGYKHLPSNTRPESELDCQERYDLLSQVL